MGKLGVGSPMVPQFLLPLRPVAETRPFQPYPSSPRRQSIEHKPSEREQPSLSCVFTLAFPSRQATGCDWRALLSLALSQAFRNTRSPSRPQGGGSAACACFLDSHALSLRDRKRERESVCVCVCSIHRNGAFRIVTAECLRWEHPVRCVVVVRAGLLRRHTAWILKRDAHGASPWGEVAFTGTVRNMNIHIHVEQACCCRQGSPETCGETAPSGPV